MKVEKLMILVGVISFIASLAIVWVTSDTIRILKETVAIQDETIQSIKTVKVIELARELTSLQDQSLKPGYTMVTVFGSADGLEIGEAVRIELESKSTTTKVAETTVGSLGDEADIRIYWYFFELPFGVYTVKVSSRLGTLSDTKNTAFQEKTWWQFDLKPSEPKLKAVTH